MRGSWSLSCLVAMVLLACGCEKCSRGERREPESFLQQHRPSRDAGPPKRRRSILPEAEIREIEGDVAVDRSRRVRRPIRRDQPEPDSGSQPVEGPAAVGDELWVGDALSVGERGRIELAIPDQGTVAIGNESWTIVSPYGTNEIGLVRGRLHVTLDAPIRGRRALKVSTASAHVIVQGTQVLVGAADDGATRIHAVDGPAMVRTRSGKTDLQAGGALDVTPDGPPSEPTAGPSRDEALASMDGWVQGRRVLVERGRAAVMEKLLGSIRGAVEEAPASFAKVSERREAQRTLLRELRVARRAGKRTAAENEDAQKQLAASGEELVDQTDSARAIWWRIWASRRLLALLAARTTPPAPADAELTAVDERVSALEGEASRLFRRAPRRPRPELRNVRGDWPGITPPPARVTKVPLREEPEGPRRGEADVRKNREGQPEGR